ncbi:hypothetical protein C4E24_03215 [ANME-1 cluster archaeon AG-394-G21]|nr:hypothetical protein [ANME-1 cluster archaeon AG-394-G21]
MVETVPSQINFSKLLSHTFPGIFTAIGIFMLIFLAFSHEGVNWEFQIGKNFEDWKTFMGALGALVFFGTIVGVVIDSIHHLIERKFITKYVGTEIEAEEAEVYKDLSGEKVGFHYFYGFLPLERFQFLLDNYYSYVECEFNLSISFFLCSFIYAYFILAFGCDLRLVGAIFIIFIFLSGFCFYSAKENYIKFRKYLLDMIKGAIEHENNAIENGNVSNESQDKNE